MVFRETLRLFPPVPFVGRTATKDHQLAGLHVPKDQRFFMPILTLHMDPESWGEDAESFKPARFENGLAAASKDPHAYMPFASGPRSCLGQLYAMQQAKIVLAMIVREFKFSVAPGYRHWPDMTLTLRPMLGVQLLVERA
jgi:cytochrome P450